jgi:SAM-dependent methyltransferase
MRSDFLSGLHCPYSGSAVSLSAILEKNGEQIIYGIARSEAGDFPIVEGILRLQADKYREPIVDYLRAGRRSQALTVALDETPFGGRRGAAINLLYGFAVARRLGSVSERLLRLKRDFVRALTDDGAVFAEIAEKLISGPAGDWQVCRFSMPTFLPTFPLLHAVCTDGPVLDFGCGTGQASFLISRMWPNSKIVCADHSFCSLYLAKRYFVPEANCVCLDGNYLLPFDSGQFSTIFSSDALQYIDSKLSLSQEFRRVGQEKAVTILPHLHNRCISPYAKSLTPPGYCRLFQDLDIRLMPEGQVIRDYFFNDMLDLTRQASDVELANAEQGLSLVASADASVFKRSEGLWDHRIRSIRHPCINPAYRITGEPGRWDLTRRVEERFAKSISEAGKTCIPEAFSINARAIDTAGLLELRRINPVQFARLAKGLVVLDLPERFIREKQDISVPERLAPRQQATV